MRLAPLRRKKLMPSYRSYWGLHLHAWAKYGTCFSVSPFSQSRLGNKLKAVKLRWCAETFLSKQKLVIFKNRKCQFFNSFWTWHPLVFHLSVAKGVYLLWQKKLPFDNRRKVCQKSKLVWPAETEVCRPEKKRRCFHSCVLSQKMDLIKRHDMDLIDIRVSRRILKVFL